LPSTPGREVISGQRSDTPDVRRAPYIRNALKFQQRDFSLYLASETKEVTYTGIFITYERY
jgi:hypothetical protein